MTAIGTFSDYQVAAWLGDFSTVWVSLHYDDPNVSGAYASEVFGGSYNRINAVFGEPTSRAIFNEADLNFRGMPTVKVTHIGGWNKQYNGDLLFSIPLASAVPVLAGKTFQVGAGTLAISLP